MKLFILDDILTPIINIYPLIHGIEPLPPQLLSKLYGRMVYYVFPPYVPFFNFTFYSPQYMWLKNQYTLEYNVGLRSYDLRMPRYAPNRVNSRCLYVQGHIDDVRLLHESIYNSKYKLSPDNAKSWLYDWHQCNIRHLMRRTLEEMYQERYEAINGPSTSTSHYYLTHNRTCYVPHKPMTLTQLNQHILLEYTIYRKC